MMRPVARPCSRSGDACRGWRASWRGRPDPVGLAVQYRATPGVLPRLPGPYRLRPQRSRGPLLRACRVVRAGRGARRPGTARRASPTSCRWQTSSPARTSRGWSAPRHACPRWPTARWRWSCSAPATTTRWPSCSAVIATAGPHALIRLPGYRQGRALRAAYAGATALVFPSICESFGIPAVEAMAQGTPVALADSTALPEIGGPAGWYFDPARDDSLEATLRTLLDDGDERARPGTSAARSPRTTAGRRPMTYWSPSSRIAADRVQSPEAVHQANQVKPVGSIDRLPRSTHVGHPSGSDHHF